MKLIPLTQGMYAKVDDEDYDFLMQWKWQCVKSCRHYQGYAVRTLPNKSPERMHRVLAKTSIGMLCDHIDGDTLNNQKDNLRNCDARQNAANRRSVIRSKSGYIGVYAHKKKWISQISMNGKTTMIKISHDPIECARSYDEKARELFGEFAVLNFPDQVFPL